MLDQITPVLLTFNEEANIGRSLEHLRWARDIVIVDSGSVDRTVDIARSVPQVRVFVRTFDSHSNQWNFATQETEITSEWILALDADYMASDAVIEEISNLDSAASINGYSAAFTYCVSGVPLRGSLYPPVTVLFRRTKGMFYQDGHTQRLTLDGKSAMLRNKLLHDDRKSLSHWLAAQDRYMRLEAANIVTRAWSELSAADRIRRLALLAPFAVFANCYFLKRGCLDGSAGLYYALQRTLSEALLALRILELRLNAPSCGPSNNARCGPSSNAS
jgi:glycosyltransferase involved in cell wall biosynthesis